MWTKQILKQTETAIRFRILQANKALDFQTAFHLWATSADFRTFYIDLLATTPFPAFLNQPYEFVVLVSTSLERRTINKTAFADFFQTKELVVNFDNLGKNARLILNIYF